jgi:hypothetical protein
LNSRHLGRQHGLDLVLGWMPSMTASMKFSPLTCGSLPLVPR